MHGRQSHVVYDKKGEEMNKKLYEITLNGCDDETVFEMELTDVEYGLLQRVSEKANETSTYCCMPRMYVEEKK